MGVAESKQESWLETGVLQVARNKFAMNII